MKVPTLVLGGSNDTITIPKNATPLIYEQLGSAEKGLVIFQNSDSYCDF